ncbi:CHAT domain-containing protein [Kitasatospora sp. NPDC058032]|uniref:CHAT domain-containing protein n=1 Tax=Kitasatospora sp. NPDC058032 TaxID=3346307 RepID=UPI0036D7CC82
MAADYDLHVLLYEIQEASRGGLLLAQDMNRITGTVLDHLGCATGDEAFELLYRDWKALPAGTLLSGMRAGQIISVLPLLQLDRNAPLHGRDAELLAAARSHGPTGKPWQTDIGALAAGLQARGDLTSPAELERTLAEVDRLLADVPQDGDAHGALTFMRASLLFNLAQIAGGQDDFDEAVDELVRLADRPVFAAPGMRQVFPAQLAMFRSSQATRREDEPALAQAIREMEAALAELPPDFMDRASFMTVIDTAKYNLRALRARRGGEGDWKLTPDALTAPAPIEEIRRHCALLPPGPRADALTDAAIGRSAHALAAGDGVLLAEAMALVEDALELTDPDSDNWTRQTHLLGVAHCAAPELGPMPPGLRRHHLDQGIALLRHSARAARGPEHTLWGATTMSLSQAFRRRGRTRQVRAGSAGGDHAESRRLGLDALRAPAWSVLLQSGTAHAAEVARLAGAQAREVARWSLADGAYEDAVRALDAGRGLALHAATVSATVPDLLVSLDRADLAREWRAAGAEPVVDHGAALSAPGSPAGPSSRLRRRVLETLAASPVRGRVLETPEPGEIGAALRALGATALVYLLAGDDMGQGAALLVHANGRVEAIVLDGLRTDAPPLTRYRAAGTPGRVAGAPPGGPAPAGPAAGTAADRADALAELCDWAGRAVMGPLLDRVGRSPGRAPTLVLVPMAELALVPWHAARVTGRRGRRSRACQEATVSYIPSARLLCEVAARPASAAREVLVVGNPTGDLHHAGAEAAAVHRDFHPDGALLDARTATPAAVRDWLRRQRGGVLHLACHGTVREGERHSAYLALSGGTLAAEELTEDLTGRRALELVVLAACRTNVSGRGYDEAYSLSTAFLVSGARSVLGSLWPVPDEATSLLMYLTHHYLSREGLSPGQALRRAQAWYLDDRRQAPPGMAPELAAQVPGVRADDLVSWAGFTHLGW